MNILAADDCEAVRQQNDTLRKQLRDDAVLVADLRLQVTNAVNHLAAINQTNTDLQAQIKRLEPDAARAVKLPVKLAWRKSIMGRGRVLQIHNTTANDLPAVLECGNATFGTKKFNVIVPGIGTMGAQFYEMGINQGWDFMTGDTAKISSAGFEPRSVTCP